MAKTGGKSKLKQQIDENLRRIYREAEDQPVPDRFNKLLEKLRQQEESQDGEKGGNNQ